MGNEKQGRRKNAERKQKCRGSEMNGFCLKWGQGLKASAAHRHPSFP